MTPNTARIYILTLALTGCAGTVKVVDTVCGYIAAADDATAAALSAAPSAGVSPEFVTRYLVPVGKAVVEAHDWCFEEGSAGVPEDL